MNRSRTIIHLQGTTNYYNSRTLDYLTLSPPF